MGRTTRGPDMGGEDMVERLGAEQRAEALATLPGWKLASEREAIERTFRFANFNQAWGFMSRVALVVEQLDHHPEWANVWNRVEVTLTTHDAGGLSALDVRLARAMDRIAATTGELSPDA